MTERTRTVERTTDEMLRRWKFEANSVSQDMLWQYRALELIAEVERLKRDLEMCDQAYRSLAEPGFR